MKTFKIIIAAVLIICLTSAVPVFAKSKTTHKSIGKLKSKTLSMTTVKVSWKKHKVDKYVIYKVTQGKDGKEKRKKLKTVSGKKTSVKLKLGKNKEVELYVKGVKKKKHGKKIVYEGTIYACSGLSRPEWYDTDYLGGYYHSPTEIDLCFERWDFVTDTELGGLRPTGYEVYRKEVGAEKYTLVKKVKLKKAQKAFGWTDASVKGGHYYYYKVRSYRKSGKKIHRSKMSLPRRLGATYYEGRFQVLSETDSDTMTLELISDPLNGKLIADLDEYRGFATEQQDESYVVESFSLDGQEWFPVLNRDYSFRVEPGQSFWLRFEKQQDSELYQRYKGKGWVNSFTLNCYYSGNDEAVLSVYVDEGRAVSCP